MITITKTPASKEILDNYLNSIVFFFFPHNYYIKIFDFIKIKIKRLII